MFYHEHFFALQKLVHENFYHFNETVKIVDVYESNLKNNLKLPATGSKCIKCLTMKSTSIIPIVCIHHDPNAAIIMGDMGYT